MRYELKRLLIATVVMTAGLFCCAIVTLPWSLIIFAAPFALEDALFGTSYLYNLPSGLNVLVLVLFYVIPIGALLQLLFANNKPRALLRAAMGCIVLPVAFFSLVGIRVTLDSRWPPARTGPTPSLVSAALPFEPGNSIDAMGWSPDGRYIAIGERDDDWDREITLIDASTGQSRYRVSHASDAFWASDNRLWVLGEDHWRVYSEPFDAAEQIPLGYDSQDPPLDHHPWDFEPDARILAVADFSDDGSSWIVRLWREGRFAYQVELTPKDPSLSGDGSGLRLSFSPNGTYLGLTTYGWMLAGEAAPPELWLLDVAEGRLKLLKEGKTKSWQVWDYAVQNLDPYWSADDTEILVADDTFGVERINVVSGKAGRILGWNADISEIALSHSGNWMAFERYPSENDGGVRCSRCMGVLSMHRDYVAYLPGGWVDWPYISFDWHPEKDVLAILTKRDCHDYVLFLWDLSGIEP